MSKDETKRAVMDTDEGILASLLNSLADATSTAQSDITALQLACMAGSSASVSECSQVAIRSALEMSRLWSEIGCKMSSVGTKHAMYAVLEGER